MVSIQGKLKTEKRFKTYDYRQGVFVNNIIRGTLWDDEQKGHVQELVDYMNKENPEYIFKIIKRS